MAGPNYIIGQGELLTQSVDIKTGGGVKAYPYTFEEAREALWPMLQAAASSIEDLPNEACPQDETVISVTLHPSFIAKSHFPSRLLEHIGLRLVGSRERTIRPRKYTRKQARAELPTAELFVAGPRKAIVTFAARGETWLPDEALRKEFARVEEIRALGPSRVKPISGTDPIVPLEVVLHAVTTDPTDNFAILRGFDEWCRSLDLQVDLTRWRAVGGLAFVPMMAPRDRVFDLSEFSFVRTVRRMPRLRIEESGQSATLDAIDVELPEGPAVHLDKRLAVFDGGLVGMSQWVDAFDAFGVGAPHSAYVAHGTAVTSAALFGPLSATEEVARPYSRADHWRVVGSDTRGDDFELVDVLDRIMGVLQQRSYDVVVLSLGPDEAMLDDDVHVWTSTLDKYCQTGSTLIVSAAGNNGEQDEEAGLNRIQPPSDGVNVLGVGAANSQSATWARASYSPCGPGRSPGLTKPDVLAFGGSPADPFWVLDLTGGRAAQKWGTSFAAPAAARMAVGVRAYFDNQIGTVATKALLVHHADQGQYESKHVGWGNLPLNLDDLVVCPEDEATIVYQGILEPSRFVRYQIPQPAEGYKHRVTIKATFCFVTPVDPENSLNYTQTGLGITFRPSTVGHPGYHPDGKPRQTHASSSFFGSSAIFAPEQNLRDDARRWESVLRAERRFNSGSLNRPLFDVEHLAREAGQAAARHDNVPYALVLTVRSKGEVDLYNRILQAYPTQLRVLRPSVEIPVRVRQ